MFRNLRHPVLHLLVCGAGGTDGLEPFVKNCQRQGWDVWVFATPAAVATVDGDVLAELTGHPVHVDDPLSGDPAGLPRAGALAVVPASFDSMIKLSYGMSDSYALGLVHVAIGLGIPILAMPAPGDALGHHPAFLESVGRLQAWGLSVLLPIHHRPGPADEGEPPAELPWHAAEDLLGEWMRFARVPAFDAMG
jgi:phosphopantothenoylcysteine synthetase/decarboxylase